MGVSFKVSKSGTRFRPKPPPAEISVVEVSENSKESSRLAPRDEPSTRKLEGGLVEVGEEAARSGLSKSSEENEVSFTLNLFSDGYSIGKPSQDGTALHDVPKDLHPYDRRSETLFSAIECGRLPGDILDDIPCKYVDGTLGCEVRDYRKYTSEQGFSASSSDESPIVTKISLKMSLENVVKDIPLISDNSWTYGDLMEVESRILKALQPQLCLDPSPKLDRLSNVPIHAKLNLGQCSSRMKRLRQAAEMTVTCNNKSHGKKICIDRVPESSNSRLAESGNIMLHHIPDNMTVQSNMLASRPRSLAQDPSAQGLAVPSHPLKYHIGVGNQRTMQDQGVGPGNASPVSQDMMISYSDNLNSSAHLHGKRENPEGPMSPLSAFNKRARLGPLGSDGILPQQMGSHIDGLHGADLNWRNTLLQQQAMTRGIQFSNTGIQKYSQQVLHGVLNQDAASASFATGQAGMRYIPKEEQFDGDKIDPSQLNQSKNDMQVMEAELNHLDQSRLQQRLPQHGFMRSGFSQSAWNNLGQQFDKDPRKDDQVQKRKPVQSPRMSAGALAQSPLSSKSGEFSSGSVAPHYGGVAKEKGAVTSMPAVGGAQSLTSSANDSMQRQYQIQAAAKRRSNSLPKTPAMSGVGSPVSVSNMSIPLNANSPSIGTPPLADQTMLERFSKIEMVTMRHKLNSKKNKVDDYPIRKPNNYSSQQLLTCLSNISSNEDVKDEKRPLSKSLVGGSMNVCKSRVLNFVQPERVVQGNVVSIVSKARTRMVMSEKLNGTVVMYYGDLKEDEFLDIEDYLPTLPNNHLADLLTAQFCHLMSREGYLLEDHIQQKPTRINQATSSLSNIPVMSPNNSAAEMTQYGEAVSGHQSGEAPKPNNSSNASLNASQNLVANARMLPPVNSQPLQMSQGLLSGVSMPARPHQLDQQQQQQQQQNQQHSLLQQQQQQHQFQRSSMIAPNQLSHLNGQGSSMQLGNHMVNKPSPLQMQLLQQQQQQQQVSSQQQHPQMQRKMMMGLGTSAGMGNLGNNMIGLGGLGNTMGMGGARGMGGAGISAPMGAISGIGQNPMNLTQASNISNVISQQLRSGTLTPAQAALMQSKLRMMQSRGNIIGAPQATGMTGMSGARQQMNPGSTSLSMLGQTLNRANMNPMQRSMMSPMGPPKMMQGMNLYMNQQQQQQPQQQQQLQQQQQQQQLQQQQQQLQPQQQQQLQQLQLQPQQQQQLQQQVSQQQQQQQQLQQQMPQQQQQQQQLQQLQLQQQQQLQFQQQQLQQQQQQQQQPMQQQQQQLPQQQETTSPLQAVVSPPQVGSPSTMGTPQLNPQPQQQQQQQASPQQMSQRTPMSPQQMNQRTPMSPQQVSQRTPMSPQQQISSGAIHSTGNPEACPASPQLSSQALGSVSSIANSPMDMQGVNKSNSASNT